MRKILLGFLVLGIPLGAVADPLSDVDVQLLLERLEDLRNGEQGRSESRLVAARRAFMAAVQSDAAAHDLYLKCIEKVQFEDEKRSGQDYRDWKRRHKERDDTLGFRRALRHQLGWLLLTLEVVVKPEERDSLGRKAVERLDAVFRDADVLKGQQGILRQSVLGSVYANAYGIGGLEVEDWPTGPLQVSAIYEQLIFPPLRRPDKLEILRAAWLRRIGHESIMLESWSRPAADRNERSAAMERFITERRPELVWMMELDLFASGDQKGAALRMLKHIERYLGHKNEAKWIADFESLVKTGELPPPKEDGNGRAGNGEGGN